MPELRRVVRKVAPRGGPYFDEQGFGLAHVAGNVHVLPIRKLPSGRLAVGEVF